MVAFVFLALGSRSPSVVGVIWPGGHCVPPTTTVGSDGQGPLRPNQSSWGPLLCPATLFQTLGF